MLEFFVFFWIMLLVWAGVSLYRVNQFGKFMRVEIERVYQARLSGDRETMYPSVSECYDNLKWYNPFDFNFQRMMVYDRSF
jgi:hypothetical protein